MNHALKIGEKAFTWFVVVLTIVWSMGLAALVPLAATAATCPTLAAGDLFKVSGNSAVLPPQCQHATSVLPTLIGVLQLVSRLFWNYRAR